MQIHRITFTVALTCISRILVIRDRLLGRIGKCRFESTAYATASRHALPCGKSLLDAVFVQPAARPAEAVVLICHGIGEIVEHWFPVQQLLAAQGIASLVFDYSGYGRSTGRVDAGQWEEDAIAAFRLLQRLAPSMPVSVLGFSLGSGVAAAIINRVDADRLVLCAAFTSFRAAACSVGIPRRFASAVPPLWHAEQSLLDCSVPVHIIHGERDRLFPVEMAAELAAFCGSEAELLVVPELDHNEPFNHPHLSYWGLVLARLAIQEQAAASHSCKL
jgi:uncharacterized protein